MQHELLDLLDAFCVRATTFVITGCLDNHDLMWRNKLSVIITHSDPVELAKHYDDLMAAENHQPLSIREAPHDSIPAALLAAAMAWPMQHKDEWANALWSRSDLPPLKRYLVEHRPYFSWEGLSQWRERGHDVGLHTHSHPRRAGIDAVDLDREIVAPAQLLRDRLALDFLPFSAPFGESPPAAMMSALHESGVFDCALGIAGLARRGSSPIALERISAECRDLGWPLYGRIATRWFAGR